MSKSIVFLIIFSTIISFFLKDNEKIENKENQYSNIDKNYLLGKVKAHEDTMFLKIPQKLCLKRTEYIHKDVLPHYLKMYQEAEKQGINLKIVSAFRSFDSQKWIWNNKFYESQNKIDVILNILKYSAMPGSSRHHWGTDIDLLSTQLSYFETNEGIKAYNWLCENANNFGFYQVYTNKPYIGYYEEKWHWTYLPVAKFYLEEYKKQISYEDIKDFQGSEFAKELNLFENYVFGIDSLLFK